MYIVCGFHIHAWCMTPKVWLKKGTADLSVLLTAMQPESREHWLSDRRMRTFAQATKAGKAAVQK